MSESEQRERFEAWALQHNYSISRIGSQYKASLTSLAWNAWMACARENFPIVSASPFREPFTNPASGMGIKKQ